MDKALAIQKAVIEILGTDEVYLVGGSVRDLVMGNTPKDYDFTTSMLPEEMIERVKAAGRRVYTIGEKFGTIGFKVPYEELAHPEGTIPDGSWITSDYSSLVYEYVEVTTFRSEVYTNKSRKPEVKFVPSLDEDLARRDFTMNAMVLRQDGSIYDPYGGRLDIYAKKIKTVGMPKDRIIEDPLRMLRAARFSARYDFGIDPNFTGKARHLADRIFDVSIERWVQELDKLLTSPYAEQGLEFLYDFALFERMFPELTKVPTIPHQFFDPDAAWKFILDSIDVHEDIKEPTRTIRFMQSGICARFKFSNERTDFILDKYKKKD